MSKDGGQKRNSVFFPIWLVITLSDQQYRTDWASRFRALNSVLFWRKKSFFEVFRISSVMFAAAEMSKKDGGDLKFYKALDLPKTATEAEIKKSYRKLAMRWHPDKVGGGFV